MANRIKNYGFRQGKINANNYFIGRGGKRSDRRERNDLRKSQKLFVRRPVEKGERPNGDRKKYFKKQIGKYASAKEKKRKPTK